MTRRAAGLFLLALAGRLFFALPPPPPEADAADYLRLAQRLRSGGGYVDTAGQPTAFRPPLYPLFLALTGPDVRAAAVVQSVLGAANCLLAVALASRWLTGPAPWLAGLLLAGLSLLARTAALPVFLVLLAVWVRREAPRLKAALLFLAGAALAVSPWLLRNAVVLGAPVLSTQGGITLYSSYRPPEGKIFGVLIADDEVRSAQAKGEVAADRQLTRAALRLAAAHPLRTLRLAVLKVAFLWVPIDWETRLRPGSLSPVYLFALPLAIWSLATRRRQFHPVPLLLLAVTVFSAAVYGSPRLRLPYDPLVYALAAGPLVLRSHGMDPRSLFKPGGQTGPPRPPAGIGRPLLWVWAALCLAFGLAGDLPRLAARALARALGWW